MKISVIIPTYNVEKYITDCLDSVASQTFFGKIECIIVDDCGNDSSMLKAEQFISSYKGNVEFRVLHREKNGGLSAARNSGLDAATGDYIYFLDSDDYISNDCLEKLYSLMATYSQTDMVQGGIISTNGRKIFQVSSLNVDVFSANKDDIYAKLVFGDVPVSSWNKLFCRDFLVRNNIRFYEGVIHEDVDFMYKVAHYITSIAFCDVPTYIYREQREGSILTSSNDEKSTKSRVIVYENCLRQMDEAYRQPLTRSLFLRAMYVLHTAKLNGEIRRNFSVFCNHLVKEAVSCDRMLMRLYFELPSFMQHRLYGKFYHIFKK